jgi:hypothetical protein
MEMAVMHGVARVQVKGYAEQRTTDLRRATPARAATPSDGSWARKLAADFGGQRIDAFGAGPSPDGPMSGAPVQ